MSAPQEWNYTRVLSEPATRQNAKVIFASHEEISDAKRPLLDVYLEKLGKMGWELVTVVWEAPGLNAAWLFRRPI